MSRSVKDLRELICVSRLTYHPSSDESDSFTSDDSSLSTACSNITLDDEKGKKVNISPDSGCLTDVSIKKVTNGERIISADHRKTKNRKRRKRKIASSYGDPRDLRLNGNNIPLPPVNDSLRSSSSCGSVNDPHDQSTYRVSNFDNLLTFTDMDVIASWLTRSNDMVSNLARFCNNGDNFVRFARFWLTEFPDLKKQEIYELEFNILVDELTLAFGAGLTSHQIKQTDLMHLLQALFKEYPGHLLTSHGNYLFLDYLDILSSSRTKEYKKLLSDVKCSTRNKQHAQWLLAIRAFSLVNVWSAVLKFYMSFTRYTTLPDPVSIANDTDNVHVHRMTQAIRLGYSAVVQYFFKKGHVDAQCVDSNGKTWIFHAIMTNQMSVLVYLLTKTSAITAINQTSKTGNTALHAAANLGYIKAVRLLLQTPHIDINVRNQQCDGATPLHLAVMHGHKDVVGMLLESSADRSLKMGDLSLVEIAETFSSPDMVDLVRQ